MVIDEVFEEPEEEIDDFVLKESFYTVRDGDVEERPSYMFWDKPDFQIRMHFDYANNKTEIRFSQLVEE